MNHIGLPSHQSSRIPVFEPDELVQPDTYSVLGIDVAAITLASACSYVHDCISSRRRQYICVTSIHGICESLRRPSFKTVLQSASLVTPDGMPLVWVGKAEGLGATVSRVYGPDLMSAVLNRREFKGVRHFFYGGKPGVADTLKSECKRLNSQISIVGTYTPPFRSLNGDERQALVKQIQACQPDIVWVGLSTPRQEEFMFDSVDVLNVPLMIGVGAAFDFHSRTVRQAPLWMQRSGLEWLYRIWREPRRLWKRYLFNIPLFVYRIALERLCRMK